MEIIDRIGSASRPRGDSEVLLVEDYSAHAELMIEALKPVAERIHHVWTGSEALAVLNQRTFDLIVLDLGLDPGITGMTVLHWVGRQDIRTPVVVVTARSEAESVRNAFKLGATDYIVKQPGYLDKLFKASLEALAGASPSVEPVAEALDRLTKGVFVGRSREMSQLRTAIREAAAGRGSVILLGGDPGIGKSMLLRKAETEAAEYGFRVLRAHGDDGGGASAFCVWIQVLHGLLKCPGSAEVIATQGASAVLRLMPEMNSRLSGELILTDSDEDRVRLRESLSVLLREAACRQPLILAFDDLQRADVPSLQLLRFIAREIEDLRLLVVATYRDDDSEESIAQLLTEVAHEPVSRFIPLRGLPESDVRNQVAAIFGQTCPRAFARMMHERTEGNPFFVKEILRYLLEEKVVHYDGTRWTGPTSVETIPFPPSVGNVIAKRLERLPPDARQILRIAAVSGREFELTVVQELVALSEDRFMAGISVAERANLITGVAGSRWRFSHALVQETLYQQLTPGRRAELHWRTGGLLEALRGPDAENSVALLAHHFFHGVPAGDTGKAIRYATLAGHRAGLSLGYEEAARQYEIALQMIDLGGSGYDDGRFEILLRLSEELWRAGSFDRARDVAARAAAEARQSGSGGNLARAALAFAGRLRGFGAVGCDAAVVALLEEGLQVLGEQDHALRPLLMARLAEELVFTPSEDACRSLAHNAIQLARTQSDSSVLAAALKMTHWALWVPEGMGDRLTLGDEIVRLADRGGDRAVRIDAQLFRVWSLMELGDSASARHELRLCAQLAQSQRQPYHKWVVAVTRACLAIMTGRLDQAEALAHEAERVGQGALSPNVFLFHNAQMAHLLWLRGRFDELQRRHTDISEPHPLLAPTISCARMGMSCEQERESETRVEFERWATDDFSRIQRNFTWLSNLAALARACAFLGDQGRAAVLYSLLAPFEGRNVVTVPVYVHGAVSHYLALLASTMERWEEAEDHFADALEMNSRMGTRQWVARTQLAYGSMLKKLGRPRDQMRARELLEAAAQGAEMLEMPVVVQRARDELAHVTNSVEKTPSSHDPAHFDQKAQPVPADATFPDPVQEIVSDGKIDRPEIEGLFRREGDFWTLAFAGQVAHVKDLLGLHYIAELLRHPREFLLVTVLEAAVSGPTDGQWAVTGVVDAADLTIVEREVVGRVDPTALTAYRRRLRELNHELEEARRNLDLGRISALNDEIDFLTDELEEAWRFWRESPETERVRLRVTKAINLARDRIRDVHPRMGHYVSTHITTGVICEYSADPYHLVHWSF